MEGEAEEGARKKREEVEEEEKNEEKDEEGNNPEKEKLTIFSSLEKTPYSAGRQRPR